MHDTRARFDAELSKLEASGRRRDLAAIDERRGRGDVDFVSNDYLGLATHKDVVAAGVRALEEFGAGGRAARLLGGGSVEADLEAELAAWLSAEAALTFPTGYQANVGVMSALVGPGDVVILDALAHASSIDGARLARARVVVHAHGDVEELEWHLRAESARSGRVLVATEGVFSMDGDRVDLTGIGDACARHGAVLVVDEAHAVGVVGDHGQGAWEGQRDDVTCVRIVTGGKALGVAGGFAVTDRAVRDVLVNRARSFVFTTAGQPAATAALLAAVRLCRSEEGDQRRAKLRDNARAVARACGVEGEPAAAIVPVVVGSEASAMELQQMFEGLGLDVRAVRPPTVPEGTCRLRVVAHADTDTESIRRLGDGLRQSGFEAPDVPSQAPKRTFADRCTFVAGTDTGIGKTVISAMLVQRDGDAATYWKPVQTGDDSDTATVARLTGRDPESFPKPSWELPLPASPHEAAEAAGVSIELDAVDRRLSSLVAEHAGGTSDRLVVELAGGLMVPYGDGNLQVDWLAKRRPNIVLVARSGLGTLNHTMLSLEALRARRLQPSLVVLVGEPHPSNLRTLRDAARGVPVVEIPWLDGLDEGGDTHSRELATSEFERLAAEGLSHDVAPADLSRRDAAVVWHPYTQHGLGEGLLPVVRAQGAWLELEDGRRVLDGISSWWTCLHGHAEPTLVDAMRRQGETVDHVLFAGATHEPAVRLAERLVDVTPPGLDRVFYSDNGSTAVEVALKIVLQGWRNRGRPGRTRFVALSGGYHGDTCGAMSVGDPDPFFQAYASMLFDVTRVPADAKAIAGALDALGDEAAGVIVEPLVQGAGGMVFHSPETLREIALACRDRGIPWIADEVMTGFGRTGEIFACVKAGVTPDLMCLSKGITGGILPLSATLATSAWFDEFVSDDRARMLFHGHSFTANPIACAVALASLDLVMARDVPRRLDAIGQRIASACRAAVGESLPVRQLGGIVALDLPVSSATGDAAGYLSQVGREVRRRSIDAGVLLRPLGNVIYALPPACVTDDEAQHIGEVMAQVASS